MESGITVVIPLYNHQKYILETLESCTKIKSETKLHLLVIDDGSTDRSFENASQYIKNCSQHFASVRIEKRKNVGLSASINFALSQVTTEFILLIASDDLFHENILDVLMPEFAAEPRLALAVGNNLFIDSEGNKITRKSGEKEFSSFLEYFLDHKIRFSEELLGSYQSYLTGNYTPVGWLMDTEKVREIGGWDASFRLEDWQILIRLANKFKIHITHKITASYRTHGTNTSSQMAAMLLFDGMRIFLQEYENARKLGFIDDWSAGLLHHFEAIRESEDRLQLFFKKISEYLTHPSLAPFLSTITGNPFLGPPLSVFEARRILCAFRLRLVNERLERRLSVTDKSEAAGVLTTSDLKIYLDEFAAAKELGELAKWQAGVAMIWQALLWNHTFFRNFFTQKIYDKHSQFNNLIASLNTVANGTESFSKRKLWFKTWIAIIWRKSHSLQKKVSRRLLGGSSTS